MLKYFLSVMLIFSSCSDQIEKNEKISKSNFSKIEEMNELDEIIGVLGPWTSNDTHTYLGADLKEKTSITYLWYDFDPREHPERYEELLVISVTVEPEGLIFCWNTCD